LPIRSTMRQRCWRWLNLSAATSDRRSPGARRESRGRAAPGALRYRARSRAPAPAAATANSRCECPASCALHARDACGQFGCQQSIVGGLGGEFPNCGHSNNDGRRAGLRSSRDTRQALTVALVKPGRASRRTDTRLFQGEAGVRRSLRLGLPGPSQNQALITVETG
jgi:hypothetical protein